MNGEELKQQIETTEQKEVDENQEVFDGQKINQNVDKVHNLEAEDKQIDDLQNQLTEKLLGLNISPENIKDKIEDRAEKIIDSLKTNKEKQEFLDDILGLDNEKEILDFIAEMEGDKDKTEGKKSDEASNEVAKYYNEVQVESIRNLYNQVKNLNGEGKIYGEALDQLGDLRKDLDIIDENNADKIKEKFQNLLGELSKPGVVEAVYDDLPNEEAKTKFRETISKLDTGLGTRLNVWESKKKLLLGSNTLENTTLSGDKLTQTKDNFQTSATLDGKTRTLKLVNGKYEIANPGSENKLQTIDNVQTGTRSHTTTNQNLPCYAVQGYTGKREGVAGSVEVKWEF